MATTTHDDVRGIHDNRDRTRERDRGREARKPTEIPKRGWFDIAVRVKDEVAKDNVSLIASGLALYALLAVFPALAAAVSIYGIFASPGEIAHHFDAFSGVFPTDATKILQDELQSLSGKHQALGIGFAIGVVIALWSARSGMTALMTTMNVAYGERETRGFFKKILVSMAFTIGSIVGFLVVMALVVAVPLALKALPLGPAAAIVILAFRWILLWFMAVFGMACVYRYAPSRREAQWRWITWGSAIAATLWLAGSLLFALYAHYSGTYGKTYGALGGVVVLLMWFYLTGYTIILGAEINSEMERQTRIDTTTGHEKPLGERGAYSADTVGPTKDEAKQDRAQEESLRGR
jgi:membrane protein